MADDDELHVSSSMDRDLEDALGRLDARIDAVEKSLGKLGVAGKESGEDVAAGQKKAQESLDATGKAGAKAGAEVAAGAKEGEAALHSEEKQAKQTEKAVDEVGDKAAESGVKATIASTGWGKLDRAIARNERTSRLFQRTAAMFRWETYSSGVDRVSGAWRRFQNLDWKGTSKKLLDARKHFMTLSQAGKFLRSKLLLVIALAPALLGFLSALGAGAVAGASSLLGLVRAGGAALPIFVAVKVAMLAWKQAATAVAPQLDALKKRFSGLGEAVAKGGLSKGLSQLNRDLGGFSKATEGGFGRIGAAFGRGARGLGDLLKNAETLDKVNYIFAGMEHILDYLIGTALNLGRALLTLTSAGTPVAKQMAEQFRAASGGLADWLDEAERSGKLTKWIQAGYDQLRRTIGVLVDFIIGLYNVMHIAAGQAGWMGDSIEGAAAKFRAWSSSIEGKNSIAKYFSDAMPLFRESLGLIGDLIKGFAGMATEGGLLALVKQLRSDVLPALFATISTITGDGGLVPALLDGATEVMKLFTSLDLSGITTLANAFADAVTWVTQLIQNTPGMSTFVSTFALLWVVGGAALTVIGKGMLAFLWMRNAILLTEGLTTAQLLLGKSVAGIRALGSGLAAVFMLMPGGAAAMTAVRAAASTMWTALMGPIGWIILAVLALIAVVVYLWTNCEWFRDAVMAVWDAIVSAAIATGKWFVWLGGVFVDVWDAIANAAVWAWENIMYPIIQVIWTVLRVLGAILFVILVTPFLIAWNIITAVFSWAYSAFIGPILGFIGDKINWLNVNVVQPVLGWIADKWNWLVTMVTLAVAIFNIGMDMVGGKVSELWATYISPILQWISDKWTWLTTMIGIGVAIFQIMMGAVGGKFSELWTTYVSPILDWISDKWNLLMIGLKVIKETILDPMFGSIGEGLDNLGAWFGRIVDGIGHTWNGLRSMLAVPINFVIDNVWNGGILKAWNMAAGMLGLTPAPLMNRIPENKKGGVIPGWSPGRDDQLSWVSGGEAVMRPEWTRAMGTATIDRWNKLARTGGTKAVQKDAMARGMLSPAEMMLGGDRANPGLAFAGGGVVPGQQWANSQVGKPYGWGAVGPNAYDCSGFMSAVTNFLVGSPLYSRRFTTGSFSKGSGAGGFVPGRGAFTIGVSPNTGDGIGHMAGSLGNMNVESRGSDGVVTGNNARGAINSLFPWQFFLPQVGGVFQGSAGSGSGGGGWFDFKAAVRQAFTSITDPILNAIPFHEPPQFMGIPKAIGTKVRDSLLDFALGKAEDVGSAGGAGVGDPNVMAAVKGVAAQFGWGDGPMWDAIDRIVKQESSWDPTAANGSSSARGLFQKMTSLYGPVEPTAAGQAQWGLNYIKQRYGNPVAAWQFHMAHGSYDQGGWLQPGANLVMNGTGHPEPVFNPGQWDLVSGVLDSTADMIGPVGTSGGDGVEMAALAAQVARLSDVLIERPPPVSGGADVQREVKKVMRQQRREVEASGRYKY